MEPLTTLSTALTVTKTLRDLVKGDKPNMEEIRSATVALQDSLIDLQGSVLAGQQREAALTAEKRVLAAELARLGDWQNEMSEYRLENIAPGASVYVPSTVAARSGHRPLALPALRGRRQEEVRPPAHAPRGTRGVVRRVCVSSLQGHCERQGNPPGRG